MNEFHLHVDPYSIVLSAKNNTYTDGEKKRDRVKDEHRRQHILIRIQYDQSVAYSKSMRVYLDGVSQWSDSVACVCLHFHLYRHERAYSMHRKAQWVQLNGVKPSNEMRLASEWVSVVNKQGIKRSPVLAGDTNRTIICCNDVNRFVRVTLAQLTSLDNN